MTKQEFIEKYGKTLVSFESYYKFAFTFSGETKDGDKIVVEAGGNSEDIYRLEVNTDLENIASLDPIGGSVYREGLQIETFYDY